MNSSNYEKIRRNKSLRLHRVFRLIEYFHMIKETLDQSLIFSIFWMEVKGNPFHELIIFATLQRAYLAQT